MFQRLLSNTHRTATRTVQRAVSTPNRAPFINVLPYQNFVKTRIFSSTALKSTSRSTSYFQHSKVKASESMANESMAPVHLLGIVGVLALSGVLLPAEVAENSSKPSVTTADKTDVNYYISYVKKTKKVKTISIVLQNQLDKVMLLHNIILLLCMKMVKV